LRNAAADLKISSGDDRLDVLKAFEERTGITVERPVVK